MDKQGWRSRGYLPHFDIPSLVQMVTIRLVDSLPADVVKSTLEEIARMSPDKQDVKRRKRFEAYLDQGYGSCWLRNPTVANCIQERLLQEDGSRCMLLAWTIMPNHMHFLLELADEVTLASFMRDFKGGTSHTANQMLGRRGGFWYRDYHDRYIRDTRHLRNAIQYIGENPVKAGLTERAADWPFGSAAFGFSGAD